MKVCVLALAFLGFVGVCRAQDRLEPERSIWSEGYPIDDEYEHDVVNAFQELYGRGVIARAIVIPSFENEYGVGIAKRGDNFEIIRLRPETHLWLFQSLEMMQDGSVQILGPDGDEQERREIDELKRLLPASPKDVAIERCAFEIEQNSAKPILSAWEHMLYRTSYPAPEEEIIGSDGVTYHFSVGSWPSKAGKTWSPDEGSATGLLVNIADTLGDACLSKDRSKIESAKKTAIKLCRRIECPAVR